MSKHQKLLSKCQEKPTPADITWSSLQAALESLGFKMTATGGSARKFYHAESDVLICCHKPHPTPIVGRRCIREVVELLINHNFL